VKGTMGKVVFISHKTNPVLYSLAYMFWLMKNALDYSIKYMFMLYMHRSK